jgi:hypothetical protein
VKPNSFLHTTRNIVYRIPPGLPAAAICLALYLRTLAPDVLGGDAGEMQFVPAILSLAHPTGYPLQTLLGRLWAHLLPVGTVAYRASLLSAVAAAGAVFFLSESARLLTGSRLAASASGLLPGVSAIFWEQATLADKYALNALLLTLVIYTLLRWEKSPTPQRLSICTLCLGLSLTHHRSMILFLPLLAGYWLWRSPRALKLGKELAPAVALGLAPLLLYLWLPLGAARGLPPGTWQPGTVGEWLAYLADVGFSSAVRPHINLADKLADYAVTLVTQFTPPGVVLGLAGIVRQITSRRRVVTFLAPAFALQAVMAAAYEVPRYWVFFIPSFVLFGLWIGEGIAWIEQATKDWVTRSTRLSAAAGGLPALAPTALLAALVVAILLARNYAPLREAHLDGGPLDIWRQDLKKGYTARRFVENSLPQVDEGATIVADWEQATPLWYARQIEGRRRDVRVIYPVERLGEALADGGPVYLARAIDAPPEGYRLTTTGALLALNPEPATEPPADALPVSVAWEEGIELVGYRLHQTGFDTGYVLPLSLYFRAETGLEENYSVSVRLFAPDGHIVWSEDRSGLALGMVPTAAMLPGEVVGDYYEIALPRHLPAGRYRPGILLYTSTDDGWRNLRTIPAGEEIAYLPEVDVSPRR